MKLNEVIIRVKERSMDPNLSLADRNEQTQIAQWLTELKIWRENSAIRSWKNGEV